MHSPCQLGQRPGLAAACGERHSRCLHSVATARIGASHAPVGHRTQRCGCTRFQELECELVFLAMGFVDSVEVRAKIKERPLKLDEALDIAIQAAEGLRAAHQKGIVHRDIKSSNLMLTATGQVKIMDFGLAQLTDGTRLTKTDTTMGTPAYMSPEQAQRLPTDRRTDIWSLGVVIYERVSGRLPFSR